MLWKTQPDNKLKNKGHDENDSPFSFSFHHIQLDNTVTSSLGADITIDIDKSIRHYIRLFGGIHSPSSVKQMEKGGVFIY